MRAMPLFAAICIGVTGTVAAGEDPTTMPDEFTYVDSIPGLVVDLRYFGDDNFVGRRIDGYEANRLLLTRPAATALAGVQAELRALGLTLVVFDAYRPQRAVDDFVRWAADETDRTTKARYYPDVPKDQLFAKGYIAAKSSHSRGSTLDLSIAELRDGTPQLLEMGTPFDFFGPTSAPLSADVSAQARAHRLLLRTLMMQHGFEPYEHEWWHFTLANEPFPDTYFDFPIR